MGGGDDGGDGDDKEKAEEEERERQEAIREAEERRKEKHRKMEEEREKMRQEIRDKVRCNFFYSNDKSRYSVLQIYHWLTEKNCHDVKASTINFIFKMPIYFVYHDECC